MEWEGEALGASVYGLQFWEPCLIAALPLGPLCPLHPRGPCVGAEHLSSP